MINCSALFYVLTLLLVFHRHQSPGAEDWSDPGTRRLPNSSCEVLVTLTQTCCHIVGFRWNDKHKVTIVKICSTLSEIFSLLSWIFFVRLKYLLKMHDIFVRDNREFQQGFTTDLPTIYQQCLDKNILILLYVFSKKYLATVN